MRGITTRFKAPTIPSTYSASQSVFFNFWVNTVSRSIHETIFGDDLQCEVTFLKVYMSCLSYSGFCCSSRRMRLDRPFKGRESERDQDFPTSTHPHTCSPFNRWWRTGRQGFASPHDTSNAVDARRCGHVIACMPHLNACPHTCACKKQEHKTGTLEPRPLSVTPEI